MDLFEALPVIDASIVLTVFFQHQPFAVAVKQEKHLNIFQ
jgi:hypothetical protein